MWWFDTSTMGAEGAPQVKLAGSLTNRELKLPPAIGFGTCT